MLTVMEYDVDKNGHDHAHHAWQVNFETVEQAESAIKRHLEKFDESGFDNENGYWWAKGSNAGISVHRRFVVNGSGTIIGNG